jgi:hypothetical protein
MYCDLSGSQPNLWFRRSACGTDVAPYAGQINSLFKCHRELSAGSVEKQSAHREKTPYYVHVDLTAFESPEGGRVASGQFSGPFRLTPACRPGRPPTPAPGRMAEWSRWKQAYGQDSRSDLEVDTNPTQRAACQDRTQMHETLLSPELCVVCHW